MSKSLRFEFPRRAPIIAGPHLGLKGRVVRMDVLERGRVVRSLEGFNNLILDQGLNEVANRVIALCFVACAVGTGNTAPANAQTSLVAESVRTSTYLTGAGNCGTTRNSNTRWTMRRTFDFPIVSSGKNYTELGFSWSATAGANLFSRVLIQSGGVPITLTLVAGQQLRVVYEVYVDFSAAVANWNINAGGAWGTITGTSALQANPIDGGGVYSTGPLAEVTTTGTVGTISSSGEQLEPSIAPMFYACSTNQALAAIGSANVRTYITQKTGSLAAYTAGNSYRDASVTYSTNEANGSIASLTIGNAAVANQQWWAALFDAAKNKTNLATLSITVRRSWGRL